MGFYCLICGEREIWAQESTRPQVCKSCNNESTHVKQKEVNQMAAAAGGLDISLSESEDDATFIGFVRKAFRSGSCDNIE